MSLTNGAPGVNVTEVDESASIEAASFGTGAFLGLTQRGIPDKAVLVTSPNDFALKFGKSLASSDLPIAAKMALELGCSLYIVRVTAHDNSNVTKAVAASVMLSTAGGGSSAGEVVGTVPGVLWNDAYTWAFASGDKLGIKVDGAAAVDATITAAAASAALSNSATFALADLETILYKVGPSTGPVRTLTFHTADFGAIGAATPAEVAAVLARDMVGVTIERVANQVTIFTDEQGTAARLEFTGGTALAALGLAVAVNVGSGNVADVDHVTAAELTTLVSAIAGVMFTTDASHHGVIENTALGSAHSVQIDTGNGNRLAGAAVLGLDTTLHSGASNTAVPTLLVTAAQGGLADPGTWGNGLTVDAAPSTNNPTTRFKLTVKLNGSVVGTPQDELTLDPTDARYAPLVYSSDPYIMLTDENAFATVGSYAAAVPATQTGTVLTGGDDGLTGLGDSDYVGDSTAKTGLHALDAILDAPFVGAPGYTSRNYLVSQDAYVQARLDMIAVGDVPKTLSPSQVVDFRKATGAYAGGVAFNTTYSALYHNWLLVTDPVTKLQRYVSPMGGVFAAYANAHIDDKPTAFGAPAGPQGGVIPGVFGVYADLSDDDVGLIYSAGVNPIINHPRFGVMIDGQKTMPAVPSDLDRVNVRRGFIQLRTSLKPAFEQVALFQPDDLKTWRATEHVVEPFMNQQVAIRAVAEYLFQNDATTNTPTDIQQHRMNPKLFVKPTETAEFIDVEVIDVLQSTNLTQPL